MPGYALKEGQVKNKSLFLKYKCHSCSLTLRDAVQLSCGHWLCEPCIQELFKQDKPVCPKHECREPLQDDDDSEDELPYFPDNFVRREISNLMISCKWNEKGCIWEGKLKDYEAHLKLCEYKVTECCETKTVYNDISKNIMELKYEIQNLQLTFSALNGRQQWHADKSVECCQPSKNYFNEGYSTNRSKCLCGCMVASTYESHDDSDSIVGIVKALFKLMKETNDCKCEGRDFRQSLIENSNYDGRMIWKIPQFSQRMSDAHSGKYTSIFSLPFYTSRYGYKMCLRLYILGDGIGKNNYMSLFFVIMRGEFDNILQWPFTHKVTFRLINQSGNRDVIDTFQPEPTSSSFRKPESDMNIASGCPCFISHTDLMSKGFVADDMIFIKCEVDTKDIGVL